MVQVAFAVVLQDVVLAGHGVGLQLGGAEQLRGGVELFGLRQMGDVAGVDQEGRLVCHPGDLAQRFLEGAGDVGVHRLVEAQMAVADLGEGEAGLGRLGLPAPMTCDRGMPPATVQTMALPAQVMHFRKPRRSAV